MSTFDGKVKEFPDIRIDHFRPSGEVSRPPLAYFLSHVHSDHLDGLESCKSPFIYCSPATKEILLRLEKYPHRMNFAKGILEARKQTYRHLRKLLKAIPLETPTVIDIAPGRSVRVTLFDANHCVGAVMFLIEGGDKAVLYTGDIRSELWWVNKLTRHPLMLVYGLNAGKKPLKQLDCIYLDTTFANKDDPYKHFPSKAEGTSELLHKVSKYPKDTVFYFDTWTFGYEDVWMALCSLLDCQVHVDNYRYGLYRALATGEGIRAEEASRLFGYQFGNRTEEGCLTARQSRLHSCEQGTGCKVFKKDFVRITPIISRHDGMEMAELGAGGGKGDLDQQHELEVSDTSALEMLMSLCATKMQGRPQVLSSVLDMLSAIMKDPVRAITLDSATLHASLKAMDHEDVSELGQLPLDSLIPALISLAMKNRQLDNNRTTPVQAAQETRFSSNLPQQITFPYSRHSSYTELCHLIEAFKPKDIWPCTVDKNKWTISQSMGFLFGHLYDLPHKFTHDQMMSSQKGGSAKERSEKTGLSAERESLLNGLNEISSSHDRTTCNLERAHCLKPGKLVPEDTNIPSSRVVPSLTTDLASEQRDGTVKRTVHTEEMQVQAAKKRRCSEGYSTVKKRLSSTTLGYATLSSQKSSNDGSLELPSKSMQITPMSDHEYTEAWQHEAFEAALRTSPADWNDITLVSVSGHHKHEEEL